MPNLNELLDNLKGDVQDKSKNPFFGAFIVTWSIRHWEVFFKIIDSDPSKESRVEIVKNYFDEMPNYDFWITVGFTFVVIILGYLFLNLARIISNLSEKILTPLIYKWTAGRGSIVLKEEYDKVSLREDKLKEKLQKEKEEKVDLEAKLDVLESQILKLKNSPVDDKIQSNINEKNEIVIEPKLTVDDQKILKTQVVFSKLEKLKLIKDFVKVSSQILSGIPLEKFDEDISKFVSFKLIRFINDVNENHGTALFDLTDLGNNLLDKINYEEENTL